MGSFQELPEAQDDGKERRVDDLVAEYVESMNDGETLNPDAVLAKHPDVEQAYRDLFSGRPVEDQYAIQADGERLGASTWRAFARDTERDEDRVVFLDCAELEEASAAVLEALVAAASE